MNEDLRNDGECIAKGEKGEMIRGSRCATTEKYKDKVWWFETTCI